MNELTLKES